MNKNVFFTSFYLRFPVLLYKSNPAKRLQQLLKFRRKLEQSKTELIRYQ